ncbi:hypothetical protein BH09ACT7_BH09ACT7_29020 [soil metagenome]
MADGFKFEINEEGMRQLEREPQEKFSAGIQVPLGGSEADAIESVKEQLRGMGAEPNDAEVAKIVREARETHRT